MKPLLAGVLYGPVLQRNNPEKDTCGSVFLFFIHYSHRKGARTPNALAHFRACRGQLRRASPGPAPAGADPPPHCAPHGSPQRRAAPHVQRRCDQCVQTRHDGEHVSGFVPKSQTAPGQLSDYYIDK